MFLINADLEKEILNLNDSRSRTSIEGQRLLDFFFTLAACNTVIVAKQPFQIPVGDLIYPIWKKSSY